MGNTAVKKCIAFAAFVLGLATSVQVHATTVQYTVDALANASANNPLSSISLIAGEIFSVSVNSDDLWTAGDLPRWSNADGLTKDLFATGSDESGALAGTLIGQDRFGLWTANGFTAAFGTLVGEIDGEFILLGTSFTGAAPSSGVLHLMYWDSYFLDNAGDVLVTIRTSVPEPGSLPLLLGGLVLLSSRMWRRRSA
jgi:hypothetical protein